MDLIKDIFGLSLVLIHFPSMLFEFDVAYRYRMQIILSMINKEWIMANPRKEILRILWLGEEAERKKYKYNLKVIATWNTLWMGFWFISLWPRARRALKIIAQEIKVD